ncbi:hypothetical protein PY247_14100 [Acinetobacter proteolyticus]|nr:hypothetical protein [Acinetobacter proteolyticus]WEI17559.1 hypothetical protein PY247_14100 [Acinetobacter proteolyticus]
MSVFNRHIVNCPPFGKLKYGSAHWLGEVELDAFEGMYRVIVRAKRDGPTDAQIAAMTRLLSDVTTIKTLASKAMVDLFEDCELLPSDFGSDVHHIWQYLSPCEIEVSDENYFGGGDNRINIMIIFESPQHLDFFPAIVTIDGYFEECVSGT